MNKILLAILLVALYGFLDVKASVEDIRAEKHLELMKALDSGATDDFNRKHYKPLIQLSENHSEKCGIDEILSFRHLIEAVFYRDDPDDLKFYKNYQWKKRVEACHETWTKNIENEVKTLNVEDEKAVKAISEEIKKRMTEDDNASGYKGYFMDHFAFHNGVFDYWKQRTSHEPKELMDGKKGMELFKEDVERLVINPCKHLLEQLHDSMSIYNSFIYTTSSVDDIIDKNDYTKSWLENYGICKVITRTKGFLGFLHKMLKDENPQYTRVGKVLGCIGINCELEKKE